MTRKKTATAFIVVIVMILCATLIGISFDNKVEMLVERNNNLIFAVVLKSLDSEHWNMVKKGAEDAGIDYNIDVIVMAPEKETMKHMQFQIIHDLIRERIDGIAIAPSDSVEVIDAIDEAVLWDIPVFTLDTNASTDKNIISFIGTDNFYAGKLAAYRMTEILNGTGLVAILTGSLNQQTHVERLEGFEAVIKENDIEVVDVRMAMSDSDLAFEETLKLLNETELDAIYATNALMAMGAFEAVKIADRDIKIIGFDIQKELLTYIKEGSIDSTVSQDPYKMGYQTVEAFYNYKQGNIIKSRIVTEATIISKENLNYFKKGYKFEYNE